MADLITIATTAALTQFVGPTAKHLGEQALERAKQVAGLASAWLGAAGREPQPVEPKLLLPIMQGAGLETDPTLTEHWAALLANAADPAQLAAVQPGFADVLRQLTPMDAQILLQLYEPAGKPTQPVISGMMTKLLFTDTSAFDYQQVGVSVDNLLRQQLCAVAQEGGIGMIPTVICGTRYGLCFMRAVTPPAE